MCRNEPWVPTNPWSSPGTVVLARILTAHPKSPSLRQLPSSVKNIFPPKIILYFFLILSCLHINLMQNKYFLYRDEQ